MKVDRLLVLSSLNAVTKDAPIVAMIFGRPSPDPGLGSPVELGRSHTGRLLDLLGIGEALSGQSIAVEKPPTDPNQPSWRFSRAGLPWE
jgi:hypothetical protein